MSVTAFPTKANKPFQPGRKGLWASDSPIAADGELGDLVIGAQDDLLSALTDLNQTLQTTGAKSCDEHLERAEKFLRQALNEISEARTRLVSVPDEFGEG